jgi:chromate transport protein ChrA
MSTHVVPSESPDAIHDTHPRPALGRLAWVFARFGNTVFGGGTPTVMVLEREIVDHHQWLDRRWMHLILRSRA